MQPEFFAKLLTRDEWIVLVECPECSECSVAGLGAVGRFSVSVDVNVHQITQSHVSFRIVENRQAGVREDSEGSLFLSGFFQHVDAG